MAAAVLFTLLPLYSQVSTGSVAGQVTDSSGVVIASAKVTLVNEGTSQERTATTEASGAYLFPLVQSGLYSVRVEMQGFKAYIARKMEVQVSQQVTHDVRLDVGKTPPPRWRRRRPRRCSISAAPKWGR